MYFSWLVLLEDAYSKNREEREAWGLDSAISARLKGVGWHLWLQQGGSLGRWYRRGSMHPFLGLKRREQVGWGSLQEYGKQDLESAVKSERGQGARARD